MEPCDQLLQCAIYHCQFSPFCGDIKPHKLENAMFVDRKYTDVYRRSPTHVILSPPCQHNAVVVQGAEIFFDIARRRRAVKKTPTKYAIYCSMSAKRV